MIEKIGCIEIPVSDMEKAVGFYEKLLKLRKTYEHPMWTAFDVGGVTFALAASGTKGRPKGSKLCTSCEPCVFRYASGKKRPTKEDSGISSVIYFRCANLDATYKRLVEEGVRFVGEPKKQGWGGRTAAMLDLDNNIIVFTEMQKELEKVIECKPPEALMDLSRTEH